MFRICFKELLKIFKKQPEKIDKKKEFVKKYTEMVKQKQKEAKHSR